MVSTFWTGLASGDDAESGQALDLLIDQLLAESVSGSLLGVVAYIMSIGAVAVDGVRTLSTAGVVDDDGRLAAHEHLRGGVLIRRAGHDFCHGSTSRQLEVVVRCS